MIDTHCHLNLDEFADDIDQVVSEANEIGVNQILVPGIDAITSLKSIELSEQYRNQVFTAVGIHPNYSVGADIFQIEEIIKSHQKRVKAIGEIGLDFYRDFAPRDTQISIFDKQLDLAIKYELPICIHTRDAEQEMIQILDAWQKSQSAQPNVARAGVFHAYNGSKVISEWGVDHNFFFGIGGPITYKKSNHLQEIVKEIGLLSLVLETDSPYLAPAPFRGKRNVPKYLDHILEELANLFSCSRDHIEEVTDANAKKLFGLNKKCP